MEVPIYSRSVDPREQYWEIPPEPKDYKIKRRAEKQIQVGTKRLEYRDAKPDHQDPELTKYTNQEWFRRLNGFWFMNAGTPTYITGVHYFYLAHWTLDVGPPKFFHSDKLYFYFLASAFEDPRCLGIINFANRRSGKSYKAGAVLYEGLSRVRNSLGGIQSKNFTDAGVFFQKCVTVPLGKLKDFFIPEYDKQMGLDSKSKIRFFRKSRSGDENIEIIGPEPLGTEIDFRESGQKAYDNTKLKIGVHDEFGKLDAEHSLIERHNTVRWCAMDGGVIVGKFVYCTTVEDMASGKNIRESRQMFDESNPLNRPANNETESGLYRFRLPAYETYKYDIYGMPLIEQSRMEIQAKLDVYLLKGDYIGYASLKRKQPFTDADIFRVAANAPVWDIIKISDQITVLSEVAPELLRISGNFSWEKGERDTRVKFVPMKNGRFSIHPDIVRRMEQEQQNLLRPINSHRFVSGCDPFEQKFAVTPSNGAAYVYQYPDLHCPETDNWLVLEYCGRPQPNIFFEDMLKMCIFFGMKINVENNIGRLIDYISERGYGNFLYWFPGAKKPGIYASTESKEKGSDAASEYITDFCHCIPFPALLEDAAMFDLSDSTKFDRSMAFIWTMLAVGNRGVTKKERDRPLEVADVVQSHKIRGR